MTAIQFEPGTIVVKLNRLPPVITMTTGAGSNFCGIKLLVMYIGMAIQTTIRQQGKLLLHRSIKILFKVTLFTTSLRVFSGELEISGAVIKFHLAPRNNGVTAFAVLISKVLLINEILMNIFMAIGTSFLQIFKYPFCPLLMTGKAWCR